MFYHLYDRKSNRHNWQIAATTDNVVRLAYLAQGWRKQAAKSEGWDSYQQKVIRSEGYHDKAYSLPRNDKQGTVIYVNRPMGERG